MSLAIVHSRALVGMHAPQVRVEVHLANGLPAFTLVGLPQAEVRESRERVRAAIQHLDFEFPNRRITVNLAPADLPKDSGRFDLPIALGILAASGQLSARDLDEHEAVGELSLTGELLPIRGAIAMALALRREDSGRCLLLPAANAADAALIGGTRWRPVRSLADLRDGLRQVADRTAGGAPGRSAAPASPADDAMTGADPHAGDGLASPGRHDGAASRPAPDPGPGPDFADVKGHALARRALEIAAAGHHSLLFSGPPGAGKSMLAQRLPSILPPMSDEDAAEVAALTSLRGPFDVAQWGRRPYRAPHHTASAAALVGGGGNPRPGEISLAHCGVLFLDELPEFGVPVLESLREPLENGRITLSRALRAADFPARFQLVAAMNPCPCGHFGGRDGRCRCSPDQVQRYLGRVSGPLLDRIDLRLHVAALEPDAMLSAQAGESSAAIRARVVEAAARQQARQGCANGFLAGEALARHCALDTAGRTRLHQAIASRGLSGRAVHRLLRVARTAADLEGEAPLRDRHVLEALTLRGELG